MNKPEKNLSPVWTHLTSEGNKTGTWRAALPHYQDQPSPCLGACPVSGRIANWIGQVEKDDLPGAWNTLCDSNPFPAIAGRICHHPCETACNRAELDETVSICALERHVGDVALDKGWAFAAPQTEVAKSVAVVGGGPAGLSAAYQLRRAGLAVTVYEARDMLGGLMRYGIPSYRLSRAILDGEIDRIVAMGIDVKLNAGMFDRAAVEALAKAHDAVFLATGASLPKRLPSLDYEADFVVDSADFLAAPDKQQTAMTGAHVLVIGGGSAAMDVARTARRLNRDVTVLTLEPEGQLPAQQAEIDEALEEGIVFVTAAMLQSAVPNGENITLNCTKVEFITGETRGEFRVEPIKGSDFHLTVNTIIPAIGQDADLQRWDGLLQADGPVLKVPSMGGATSHERIFAGGDVSSMERFVTHAIGMGKQAARDIIAMLAPDAELTPENTGPLVGFERINTAYQVDRARNRQGHVPVSKRLSNFAEVQEPLGFDAARSEAGRCFSCGTCTNCDNCYLYCPDMAINRLLPGYEVRTDYCKGCGLCVAECPTGSIHMQEDSSR